MFDELPTGDSRCSEKPPTGDFIKSCIKSLRTVFGEDIVFAKDDGKWYHRTHYILELRVHSRFICGTCLRQARQRKMVMNNEERVKFLAKVKTHTDHHRVICIDHCHLNIGL